MKKLMFVVILALVYVFMYEGGCFKDFDFYYGSKIVKILQGDQIDGS